MTTKKRERVDTREHWHYSHHRLLPRMHAWVTYIHTLCCTYCISKKDSGGRIWSSSSNYLLVSEAAKSLVG